MLFSSCSKAEEFFSYLNNLHLSLKYTMEISENNQLSFQDVLVERTPWVFSLVFTGNLTWDSFSPKTRKINLINSLTNCALMLLSKFRLRTELKKIKWLFFVVFLGGEWLA